MTSQTESTAAPPAAFAARVRSAVAWRWGSQVLAQIIAWTSTVIVVRLLDPSDYGLFAMTQAVFVALNFLNGYSFATSLIQATDVDQRRIGQAFGLLILANAALAFAQFALAPVAAGYYGEPAVAAPLLLAVTLALTLPAIGLRFGDLLRTLQPIAFACTAMAVVVVTLRSAMTGMPPPAQLAALVPAGAAAYSLVLWLCWPQVVRETLAMLRQRDASPPTPSESTNQIGAAAR